MKKVYVYATFLFLTAFGLGFCVKDIYLSYTESVSAISNSGFDHQLDISTKSVEYIASAKFFISEYYTTDCAGYKNRWLGADAVEAIISRDLDRAGIQWGDKGIPRKGDFRGHALKCNLMVARSLLNKLKTNSAEYTPLEKRYIVSQLLRRLRSVSATYEDIGTSGDELISLAG